MAALLLSVMAADRPLTCRQNAHEASGRTLTNIPAERPCPGVSCGNVAL
jgi:hypothetical protein